MKWILIAIIHGSAGMGPTVPLTITAEFDDRPACEAGAAAYDTLSRRTRISGRAAEWVCVPKATPAK